MALAVLGIFVPSATASTSGTATIRTGPDRAAVGSLLAGIGPMGAVRSTNWAGYVGTGRTFSSVQATWEVPRVTCTSEDSVASFWVGIDGYRSNTVEQAGTLAYCHAGKVTYYTWWEMFPAKSVQLVGSTVRPGDDIAASVSVTGHTYTLKVADSTSPANSFTKTASCAVCRNASVDWIAERPGRQNGLFPLAKFGHLRFFEAGATVGGIRGSISRFDHDAITMINRKGATMARVSDLRHGGKRFVATWLRMQ